MQIRKLNKYCLLPTDFIFFINTYLFIKILLLFSDSLTLLFPNPILLTNLLYRTFVDPLCKICDISIYNISIFVSIKIRVFETLTRNQDSHLILRFIIGRNKINAFSTLKRDRVNGFDFN